MVLASSGQGRAMGAAACRLRGPRHCWSGCGLEEALPLRANPFCLDLAILATQEMGANTFELGRYDTRERDARSVGDSIQGAVRGGCSAGGRFRVGRSSN